MKHTPVDGLATSPSAGPITGLNEEVWDDPVSPYGKRINLGCSGLRCTSARFFRWKGNGYLPVEYDTVVVTLTKGNQRRKVGGENLKLTLHGERDEVSACLRTLLGLLSGPRRRFRGHSRLRTLDQSSMSSSPAVVLMITLPLVGRAIGRRPVHVTGGAAPGGCLLLNLLPMCGLSEE